MFLFCILISRISFFFRKSMFVIKKDNNTTLVGGRARTGTVEQALKCVPVRGAVGTKEHDWITPTYQCRAEVYRCGAHISPLPPHPLYRSCHFLPTTRWLDKPNEGFHDKHNGREVAAPGRAQQCLTERYVCGRLYNPDYTTRDRWGVRNGAGLSRWVGV